MPDDPEDGWIVAERTRDALTFRVAALVIGHCGLEP
jgi:hypothetical protein